MTGLPPKSEEVQKFLNDESPDAYEKVVEKFIARIDYEIEISYACTAPKAGEVTLELLNRLDQIELTRATTTFA